MKLLPFSSAIRDEVMPDQELQAGVCVSVCVCVCWGDSLGGLGEWIMGSTAQSFRKNQQQQQQPHLLLCLKMLRHRWKTCEVHGNHWRSSSCTASEAAKLQPLCTSVSGVILFLEQVGGTNVTTLEQSTLSTTAAVKVKTHEMCPDESRRLGEKKNKVPSVILTLLCESGARVSCPGLSPTE